MNGSPLRIEGLVVEYAGAPAVRGVDLEAPAGALVVLLGPSGCGKSTTLRAVAGLVPVAAGRIAVGGDDVTRRPPWERDVAMVFQNYALYPHLTAFENIAFPLRRRGAPAAEVEARVREAAGRLGIDRLLGRRPRELSGGERQRVALARAIVRRPRAFLMDEPLSNLDAALRVEARTEIRRLVAETGTTTLYVTHDQAEAMALGDIVAVMMRGEVLQAAPPREVYRRPATVEVARFLGSPPMNVWAEGGGHAGVRPEDVRIVGAGEGRPAVVEAVEDLGDRVIVHLSTATGRLVAAVAPGAAPRPGDRVGLVWDPAAEVRFM